MEGEQDEELVILRLEDESDNDSEAPTSKRPRRSDRLLANVASMLEHVQSLVDNMENPTDKAYWLNSNYERKLMKEPYLKMMDYLPNENSHAHEYFLPTLSMFESSQNKNRDEDNQLRPENPYRSNVSYETVAWMKRFQISPTFIKLFLRDLNSMDDLDFPINPNDSTPTSLATVRNHGIFWQPLNELPKYTVITNCSQSTNELEPIRELPYKMKEFVDIVLRKTFHEHSIPLKNSCPPISLEKLVENIECLQIDERPNRNKVFTRSSYGANDGLHNYFFSLSILRRLLGASRIFSWTIYWNRYCF